MASESKSDPHLGSYARFEKAQEPTPIRPVVPMKLPSADPFPPDDSPEDDPEPEFPSFPGIRRLPCEEITKQMQLLC
jgi:hypothetical protein